MTVHARRANGSVVDIPLFNPFAMNDRYRWAYPSFANALMDTQKAASAYLEASSKLMDEIREILRRELDLSLQISRQMLDGASDRGRPAMPYSSDVNSIFDCAIANWRELGEAWMNAQMRSLDAMRGQTSNGLRRHARQQPPAAE